MTNECWQNLHAIYEAWFYRVGHGDRGMQINYERQKSHGYGVAILHSTVRVNGPYAENRHAETILDLFEVERMNDLSAKEKGKEIAEEHRRILRRL